VECRIASHGEVPFRSLRGKHFRDARNQPVDRPENALHPVRKAIDKTYSK